MMKKFILPILCIAITFAACKDDDNSGSSSGGGISVPGERGYFFIEATFDGVERRADYIACRGEECLKNYGNYSPKTRYSNFVREFFPLDYTGKMFIYFYEYDLVLRSFPDTLPFGSSFSDGKLEFDYYEKPNDIWITYKNGSKPFELIITSFNNDTLKGTFSGSLVNIQDTSDVKTVSNGNFEVLMYNTDS